MEFAIWAYPWDLIDEGVSTAVDRLAKTGIDSINLATNYHAVHSFSPTNPDSRSYFAHASSYFQPDESNYGDLVPVPAERMGEDDWVASLTRELSDASISVTGWTVGCHNSRLGLANPDLTVISPHGDSLPFALCPSKPTVRSYLTGLLQDLTALGEFDRIELESFDYFFGNGLGWHHDKVFVTLGKLGAFLMGLCFCEDCQANAAIAGVDVDAARRTCIETIDAIVANDLPASLEPLRWVRSHPHVAAYTATRERTLVSLYNELSDLVDCELGYTIGLLDVGDEWLFGADLSTIGEHVDYYTALAYESSGPEAAHTIETANALLDEVPIHAGVHPGPQVVRDGETLAEIVDAVAATGTERISFYNYGPLPSRSFDWIAAATNPFR